MSKLEIHQFPARSDNYGVLVHEASTGQTASIDAPDAAAVEDALAAAGWTLTHIFTTHHHGDHTAGNEKLKAATGCKIIGPKAEADKIPGLDEAVGDGDTFAFGDTEVHVIETPGHTLGHVAYYIPSAGTAFVGDTLFAMGCGRVFEGSYDQMWQSLEKLMQLPPETTLYCGHEYTQANAKFALTVDPDNEALKERAAAVGRIRANGAPTLPTRMERELATNPFLRVGDAGVRATLGMADATDAEVFAELRQRKDRA